MKRMKLISKTAAALTLIFCASAQAAPMNIADDYWGSDSHGHGDVIGDDKLFGISSMDVELVGSLLSVTINTPFANTGLGQFTGLTSNGLGIGFGDLFLSSTGWDPDPLDTSTTAFYDADDHKNGTLWDFGISLDARWDKTSSVAKLYGLNAVANNPDALLSEELVDNGGTIRDGQEVAVDTGTATLLSNTITGTNLASFDASTAGALLFTVDVTGTALENAESIGLHWAMTCGNDTIEGEYKVPEPSTLALFGLALLGLGLFRLKKKSI